jgi:ribosome maturation factor RimP
VWNEQGRGAHPRSDFTEEEEHMNTWRKFTAIGLVIVLMHVYVADLAMARSVKSSVDPAATKLRVELMGAGAKVEVKFRADVRWQGTIQSIGDDGFVMTHGDAQTNSHVAYDQVMGLTLSKLSYKAAGQPDASEARRVVAGWGVGKAIRVTLVDGRKLKGEIQSMDKDHFMLLSNSQPEPYQIAYSGVRQVGTGGMTTGTSWALVGIVFGTLVVVLAIMAKATSG